MVIARGLSGTRWVSEPVKGTQPEGDRKRAWWKIRTDLLEVQCDPTEAAVSR